MAGKPKDPKTADANTEAEAHPNEANEANEDSASEDESSDTSASSRGTGSSRTGGSAQLAEELLERRANAEIHAYVAQMLGDKPTAATAAARIVSEVASRDAAPLGSQVEKLVNALRSSNKRVVQSAADALPAIAKVAPAKVAKQLEGLRAAYAETTDVGKDGLVRTFANLCSASVAYQKRLEPILSHALGEADGKTLVKWSETVLPALKGEPHANARAVVEGRLYEIPRKQAQSIADFLGIKLRVQRR